MIAKKFAARVSGECCWDIFTIGGITMCVFRNKNRSFNILLVLIAMLATLVLLTGCEGKDGVTGPAGQDGADGADGVDGIDGAGTRLVYEGMVNNDPFVQRISEISLDDMPVVSVFISTDENGLRWYEIPAYWVVDGYLYSEFYVIHEGSVELFGCIGYRYKIVVVN